MRVTFTSGDTAALNDLENVSSELLRIQRQVSSGKRLQAPSDDPNAWAAGVRERSVLAAADQYSSATDSASSKLTVIDTVLSDMVNQLTSARSTVVAGQGTTQSAEQRDALARQLEGIRDAVFDDFNTTFRGTYLFSGGASLTAPFVKTGGVISGYRGDGKESAVDIDKTRTATVTYVGSGMSQGTAATDIFATFDKVIAGVRNGNGTAMADGLKELEAGFNRVVQVQSRVGVDLDALDSQKTRLSQMQLASKSRLSTLEDANMVDAIVQMKQTNTAYEMGLGAIATRSRQSLLDYLK